MTQFADVAATLKKVQIFAGLTDPQLAYLAERAVTKRYAANETVFAELEPCLGLVGREQWQHPHLQDRG